MHGYRDCGAYFGERVAIVNGVVIIKMLRCERPAGHPRGERDGKHTSFKSR